jgi:hypothetical protein
LRGKVVSIEESVGQDVGRGTRPIPVRVATVKVERPWAGNPYELYRFLSMELLVGDEVSITATSLSAADLDAVAEESKVKEGTDAH